MFLIKFTASKTFFANLAIRVLDFLLKKIQLNFEKMCFCGLKNFRLVLYDSEAISLSISLSFPKCREIGSFCMCLHVRFHS